jgi:hypothetical protein
MYGVREVHASFSYINLMERGHFEELDEDGFYTFYSVHYGKLLRKRSTNAPVCEDGMIILK